MPVSVVGSISVSSSINTLSSSIESVSVLTSKLPISISSSFASGFDNIGFVKGVALVPVSYTHLTLPTNREV